MAKPNVLFLCTGNSARSQMAEALLRAMAGDRFNVFSAGIEPKGVNPLAIEALEQMGVDPSGLRSKGIEEFLGRVPLAYVIVVCADADRRCPAVWPGMAERLLWPLEDPSTCEGTHAEKLRKFIQARDQLAARLLSWLDELEAMK